MIQVGDVVEGNKIVIAIEGRHVHLHDDSWVLADQLRVINAKADRVSVFEQIACVVEANYMLLIHVGDYKPGQLVYSLSITDKEIIADGQRCPLKVKVLNG